MSLPTTYRIPMFSVEIDSTRAVKGPALLKYKVLIFGGRTSAGTIAALTKKRVRSEAEARLWWGEGSQMHLMFRSFFLRNKQTEVYGIAIDDDASGVAATKTLTFTGPATADGVLYWRIGNKRINVTVTSGDTAATMAANTRAKFLATADLPYTSGVSTTVVNLTARNKGEPGNDIDVRLNYGEGEASPSGASVVIAAGTAGSVNPTVSALITAIANEWYQIFVGPYVDATNLGLLETELTSRFGNVRMIDGQYICSKDGANYAAIQSFGAARNSAYVRCAHSFGVPWTSFEFAASWAANEALSAEADPAKPLFNQVVLGADAPISSEQFTPDDNNSLLFDGISTFYVNASGQVVMQRAITMYQTNSASAEDTSYLRAESMYTLLYLRYSFRNWFLLRYPRAKLANDGAIIPPNQSYITPKIAKAEAVAWARSMEQDKGLIENVDQFKRDLVVLRNAEDPDRLDFTISPDLINQFVVGAANMQFLLQG